MNLRSNEINAKSYIIGLTGGSGSGKSEVANMLSESGAIVINVDKVAKEVTCEAETLEELRKEFGSVVLDSDGKFARKRVAEVAFHDKEFLAKLNRVTHRFTADRVIETLNIIESESPGSVVVIDAPIPVEHGFLDQVDNVWVVEANYGTRLERIMNRDGISEREAEARIRSQMPEEEYRKIADRLITNNGSIEELRDKVNELWATILLFS